MLSIFLVLLNAGARAEPDFTEGALVPETGRANVYDLGEEELVRTIRAGRIHALDYPIETTALMPYSPLKRLLRRASSLSSLVPASLEQVFEAPSASGLLPWGSLDELYAWMGLHEFPAEEGEGAYLVPFPTGERPADRMGASRIRVADGEGLTFSCAACHSANLFGKRVIGATNRFPRANDFLKRAKAARKYYNPTLFRLATGATQGETRMATRLLHNLAWVDGRDPLTLGLDTSLAQVSLSLALREKDEAATKTKESAQNPRESWLGEHPADSKPAVWWNVKYKNRWLSDGSVVSGNPVFTNFIWNEIGRSADLSQLAAWLEANEAKVRELTTAVFASEAPRFTDFFPAESVDLAAAKRGAFVFRERCAGCHGAYKKGWDRADKSKLSPAELLETIEVRYHADTPVVDVGTDALRFLGMRQLEKDLNPLDISVSSGVVVRAQTGYVPPPLVGIWARWPYFHNNSVPSLCAVLTRSEQRPSEYWAGEALDSASDFDRECNGYPPEPPSAWKESPDRRFDTSRPGLTNKGHDEGIFLDEGEELLTAEEKRDLVVFLQTL